MTDPKTVPAVRGEAVAVSPPHAAIRIPHSAIILLLACVLAPACPTFAQGFDVSGFDRAALPAVPRGFVAELVIAEPHVRNVSSLAFDARGRLFVADGPQYRHPTLDTPGDRVQLLIDRDGDGSAEEVKRFAEGFNSIQGMAWRGRDLWVANAPDLTIVRDTDGDDVADEYVRVFTGLGTLEHGLHGLNFAPDGKLYMSKGDTPVQGDAPKVFRDLSHVEADANPGTFDEQPIVTYKRGEYRRRYELPTDGHTAGGVLRCDPDGRRLEIVCLGLRNPWDIAFDDEFNWLGTDNDDSGGDRIVMPFYGAHFGSRHRWSNHWTGRGHPPTAPISGPLFEGSGVGIVHYDTPHFPAEHRGVFFIGDWLLGEVYVYRPRWEGPLMQDDDGKLERFAWSGQQRSLFRPTDIEVGGDGALYVGGWGRQYGYAQDSEGRVYRIRHAGSPLMKLPVREGAIEQWSFDELLAELDGVLNARRVDAQSELVRRGGMVRDELMRAIDGGGLTKRQQTWAIWALGRIDAGDVKVDAWLSERADGLIRTDPNISLQAVRVLAHRIGDSKQGRSLPINVAGTADDARWLFAGVQAIHTARQARHIDQLVSIVASEVAAPPPNESAKGSVGRPVESPQRRPGLFGEWFGNSDLTRRKDDDVLLEPSADWSADRVRGSGWSARWSGWIEAPATGPVTFEAVADDGLRLRIGEKLVIDGWGKSASRTGTIEMMRGEAMPIVIEFYQAGGEAKLHLSWRWADEASQPVPGTALWHDASRIGPPPPAEATGSEGDRMVFYAAWIALRDLATVEQRKAMLLDERPGVRFAAMLGLLDTGDLTGDEVLALTHDPDRRIVELAGQWLGKVGYGLTDPARIVEQLRQLDHRHVNYELRLNLLKSLSKQGVTGEARRALREMYIERWANATLETNEVVPAEKGKEIAAAMRVLAQSAGGDEDAVDAAGMYDRMLTHGWPIVRDAAVEDFHRLGPAGRAYLLGRLHETAGEHRVRAIEALGRFERAAEPWSPTRPAVDALAETYQRTDDPRVRRVVLDLLAAADEAGWRADGGLTDAAAAIVKLAAADADVRVNSLVPALAQSLGRDIPVTAPRREPATVAQAIALLPRADAARGRRIFFDERFAACSVCHTVRGEGRAIGPDLSSIGRRADPAAIALSILEPSQTIIEGFRMSVVTLKEGGAIVGLVRDETDASLSVITPDGKSRQVSKSDIASRQALEVSLMPATYAGLMPADELADLIAWLSSLRDAEGPSTAPAAAPADPRRIGFEPLPGRVIIKLGDQPVGTYFHQHPDIRRPGFINMKEPGGTQVTRNHPPRPGVDATDHDTFHPGVWLAFGDMNGADHWRNKAAVVHERFIEPPAGGVERGSFAVVNRYLAADGSLICRETCRYTFHLRPHGLLMIADSTFVAADAELVFRSQEEMGFAVRVATPITVQHGGAIVNDRGERDEKGTWGKVAKWWDYFGVVDGRRVGVMLMASPRNPRPSWAHSRDYGALVANPFDIKPGVAVTVPRGQPFHLTYGLLLHGGDNDAPLDRAAVYEDFVARLNR